MELLMKIYDRGYEMNMNPQHYDFIEMMFTSLKTTPNQTFNSILSEFPDIRGRYQNAIETYIYEMWEDYEEEFGRDW
jgi:hypothetical protein